MVITSIHSEHSYSNVYINNPANSYSNAYILIYALLARRIGWTSVTASGPRIKSIFVGMHHVAMRWVDAGVLCSHGIITQG